MSVLVTGAAGFIGSHVTDMLLSQGRTVVGLDSFDDFYSPDLKERNLAGARDHGGFTLVRGDIRDTEALKRLPEGIDTIVHLAARAGVRPSIEDPEIYAEVNVMGTSRLLAVGQESRDRDLGLRVFFLGLWEQQEGSFRRVGSSGPSYFSVRGYEEVRGTSLPCGLASRWPHGGLPPVLHGIRATPTAGFGDSQIYAHPE